VNLFLVWGYEVFGPPQPIWDRAPNKAPGPIVDSM